MAAPQLHIAPRPHQPDLEALPDADAERRIRAMSRRGFLWGAAAVAGTVGGIGWLATRRADNGIQWPLRRLLEVNENLSRDFFSGQRLAPEFDKAAAETPRPNGDYGVADEVDPDWSLRLVGLADMSAAQVPDTGSSAPTDSEAPAKGGVPPSPADKKTGRTAVAPAGDAASDTSDESESAETTPPQLEPAVVVTMKEIRALPKTDIVTELKCIEGWSTVVHWTGVRLADFLQKYAPATRSGQPFDLRHPEDMPDYVSMETPDGAYYVGLDMASALHPQTLLCYEMNGKPLTAEHGAPLRLAIPVKYGIKNIKNIGKIKFTDERPRDYWAERGYDWYAGH
jgi:DMSO/TMAO reductase YedYZ molybdopterin-dependent catalytic subunit